MTWDWFLYHDIAHAHVITHLRGVIKKYGECLNKKKYYSKRHMAINPTQNTPPRFEHAYPIVLATF